MATYVGIALNHAFVTTTQSQDSRQGASVLSTIKNSTKITQNPVILVPFTSQVAIREKVVTGLMEAPLKSLDRTVLTVNGKKTDTTIQNAQKVTVTPVTMISFSKAAVRVKTINGVVTDDNLNGNLNGNLIRKRIVNGITQTPLKPIDRIAPTLYGTSLDGAIQNASRTMVYLGTVLSLSSMYKRKAHTTNGALVDDTSNGNLIRKRVVNGTNETILKPTNRTTLVLNGTTSKRDTSYSGARVRVVQGKIDGILKPQDRTSRVLSGIQQAIPVVTIQLVPSNSQRMTPNTWKSS